MTSKMEKPRKAETTEKAPEEKRDSALCYCKDVQRRYDGDGAPVVRDGVNHYPCAKCGKLYA